MDWEKVEVILVILLYNFYMKCFMIGDFKEVWDNLFVGLWVGSFVNVVMGLFKVLLLLLEL